MHRPMLEEEAAAGDEAAGLPAKMARTESGAARSTLRHIETEQRRRDRINDGFKALRELLPTTEKMDKANFLMACVSYIRQLQVLLHSHIPSYLSHPVPHVASAVVFLVRSCAVESADRHPRIILAQLALCLEHKLCGCSSVHLVRS